MTRARLLTAGVVAAGALLVASRQCRSSSDPAVTQAGPAPSTSGVPTVAERSRAPQPLVGVDASHPLPQLASWDDTPLPENDYLAQLRQLNKTDKRAALVLVEKGEDWYAPVGRQAEARRAMRITLLVDLGRMAEARSYTRQFIARYPQSPYRPLVQGVTGIHPRPSGPRPAPP